MLSLLNWPAFHFLPFFLGGAFFFAGAFLGDFLAAFFLGEEAGGGLDFLATTSEIPGMIKLFLLFSTVQGEKSKDFVKGEKNSASFKN